MLVAVTLTQKAQGENQFASIDCHVGYKSCTVKNQTILFIDYAANNNIIIIQRRM